LISHHESANQTRGKQLDTRGSCPTFPGKRRHWPSAQQNQLIFWLCAYFQNELFH